MYMLLSIKKKHSLLFDVCSVNECFVCTRTATETAVGGVCSGDVPAAVTAGNRTRQQFLAMLG